jgi:hypothetical protein
MSLHVPNQLTQNDRITSYINNLHPKTHKALYNVIERIIELTIPLWNTTLTPLKSNDYYLPRIMYDACTYDPDPESLPEEEQPQRLPNETEEELYERRDQWARDTRRVVKPEPGKFAPPPQRLFYFSKDGKQTEDEKLVDLRKEYADRGLQIIVKLANIHLTPEKPYYDGGTWHVEGQLVRIRPILAR